MFRELRLSVIGKPPETALTLTGPPRRHLNITLIALRSLYADAKYELNNSFAQNPFLLQNAVQRFLVPTHYKC